MEDRIIVNEVENDGLGRTGHYQEFFVWIMGLLVFLWLIFLLSGKTNQLNIFFRQGEDFFGDFVSWCTASRDPYNFETGSTELGGIICYPPLGYILMYPFTKLTLPNTAFIMAVLLYFFSLLLGALLVFDNIKTDNKIQKYLITLLLFSSSISIVSFERGNIIIISAMLSLLFLFGFDSKNSGIRELSYIALALSAGIKLYPAVFGILIIKRGRYKEAIRTLLYGISAFLLPFLFFKGGLRCLPIFIRNLGLFTEWFKYVDHPAFNFKYFANGINDVILREKVYQCFIILDRMLLVMAVISSLLTKIKWKEILILSVSIIWFSIHSGFYMGLFFFAGMVFFLNDAENNRINTLCFCFIVMILNPLQIVLPNGIDLTYALINISASGMAIVLIISVFVDVIKEKKCVLSEIE